jgi:hypothetical protein
MSDGPEPFRLAIITRCTVAGIRLKPGDILSVPADRLKSAVGLVDNGSARPADRETATVVELHRLLNPQR